MGHESVTTRRTIGQGTTPQSLTDARTPPPRPEPLVILVDVRCLSRGIGKAPTALRSLDRRSGSTSYVAAAADSTGFVR